MDINILLNNDNVQPQDLEYIFSNEPTQTVVSENLTDLVCELGLFKSKSQARKAGRVGDIPVGYSEYKANKKTYLFIWNPSE